MWWRRSPRMEEGTGKRDAVAPVQGAVLKPLDLNSVVEGLPAKERARIARSQLPNRTRRERFRLLITVLLLVGIIADGFAALYLVEVTGDVSWDTAKDWLALAVAPLVAASAVAATFWFPSRESD